MTQLFEPTTYIRWRPLRASALLLIVALVAVTAISPLVYGASSRQIPPGCTELIINGDFETIGPEWELQSGARPPMLANDVTHNDSNNSMQLGIVNLSNVDSTSFAKQTVNLPTGVSSITLTFYYYTRWSGTPDAEDIQYAEIFNNLTGTFLDRVLTEQSNTRDWRVKQRDLTPYSGQQISLYFVVANDGENNSVAMNVDDVSILACNPITAPTATPTLDTTNPTLTPTLTPTRTPTNTPVTPGPTATSPPPAPVDNCQNYLINGDFEAGTDNFYNGISWIRGSDPVQAELTDDGPNSGTYAALLGNPPNNGHGNIETWSSIRQLVQLPPYLTSAELRWRHRTQSQEGAENNPSNKDDRMDVIFLQPDLIPIEVINRHRKKPAAYQEETESINLAHYGGKRFFIYFNVYNDGKGGRTWSKVDNIELVGCRDNAQAAAANVAPTNTPRPSNTPQANTQRTANTPVPTKTATKTESTAPTVQPQNNVAPRTNTPDPALRSTEMEPVPQYSTERILPADGLQEPTTLPTYATESSGGFFDRFSFGNADPDPQPTSPFQWLRMAVTCLIPLVLIVLVLLFIRRRTGG